jgi:predicted MFS family arabinose efflux permease
VGTALLTGSLLALLYGIIEGPGKGWTSAHVVGGFSVGVVLMGVFVVYAMNTATPLLDPRVFKLPKLRGGTLGIGVAFFGLFSLFFVNAQFLQYAKGYSALLTGFAILPLGVGMAVASRNSVRLVGRFGARRVSGIGLGAVVAGLLLMSFVDKDTAYLLYVVYLTVLSAGLGLVTPPLSTWVMGSLPPERAGLGSGLNGAAREIGSALGVAVFGTVLISSFESHLPEGTPKGGSIGSVMARTAGDPAAHDKLVRAFTDAMSTGFRTVAVVVLVAAALVMLWSRERVRVPV